MRIFCFLHMFFFCFPSRNVRLIYCEHQSQDWNPIKQERRMNVERGALVHNRPSYVAVGLRTARNERYIRFILLLVVYQNQKAWKTFNIQVSKRGRRQKTHAKKRHATGEETKRKMRKMKSSVLIYYYSYTSITVKQIAMGNYEVTHSLSLPASLSVCLTHFCFPFILLLHLVPLEGIFDSWFGK